LLHAVDWRILRHALKSFIRIEDLLEFTIESNPDDINESSLSLWKSLGVNRLSIGVQSFREEDLKWMNRAHNSKESLECIELAQRLGFHNLTIDLMYGLPNQSLQVWEEQLHIAGKLGVPHISAYCLTVEERTALKKRVDLGDLIIPDEELVEQQFHALIDILASYGLEQYEISNFAKPGFEAVHNSNYWLGAHYLAIGPSAHGFDGVNRYWNIANNKQYIQEIEAGKLPQTIEKLTVQNRYNELILTGLRTHWGVSIEQLQALVPFDKKYNVLLQNLSDSGVLELHEGKLRLLKDSRIKADYYASLLFRV
jgi:oxygen-independent coproporphyrinogen-3 oxidase